MTSFGLNYGNINGTQSMASSILSPHVPAADFSNDGAHISYQAPSAMQSEYPSPKASPRKDPEERQVRISEKEH